VWCRNPTLGQSVKMKLTFPKLGIWNPLGLPNVLNSTVEAKTPQIGMFLVSLESSWSVDVQNGLALVIWTSVAQVMGKRKGRESNWQFDSQPLKVGNRPLPNVCRCSAMGRWKALEESYNFGLDLAPIGRRSQKLWMSKVPRVQPRTVSRLQLRSPEKKSHLDVIYAE